MAFTEQLARERTRSNLQQAEQLRYSRRLRTLRRALRLEHRAERRMIEAWRRTAELREAAESVYPESVYPESVYPESVYH